MTNEEIDHRLHFVEGLIAKADVKDLPHLNRTYQKLIDLQVANDLEGWNRNARAQPTFERGSSDR